MDRLGGSARGGERWGGDPGVLAWWAAPVRAPGFRTMPPDSLAASGPGREEAEGQSLGRRTCVEGQKPVHPGVNGGPEGHPHLAWPMVGHESIGMVPLFLKLQTAHSAKCELPGARSGSTKPFGKICDSFTPQMHTALRSVCPCHLPRWLPCVSPDGRDTPAGSPLPSHKDGTGQCDFFFPQHFPLELTAPKMHTCWSKLKDLPPSSPKVMIPPETISPKWTWGFPLPFSLFFLYVEFH